MPVTTRSRLPALYTICHGDGCPRRSGQWRVLAFAESQTKIRKSLEHAEVSCGRPVYSGVLHLAPADRSGFELCSGRSQGCTLACLNTSGHGTRLSTQEARVRKTLRFYEGQAPSGRAGQLPTRNTEVMAELVKDIEHTRRHAEKHGQIAAIRLNGTSDIAWENVDVCIDGVDHPNLMAAFPDVQFYDYTKVVGRVQRSLTPGGQWPANYHLTYSLSERPTDVGRAEDVLRKGGNVAVVFQGHLPASMTWHGFPVIDGTEHDARFCDPPGTVTGLVGLAHRSGADVGSSMTRESEHGFFQDPDAGQERRRGVHASLGGGMLLLGRTGDRAARRAGVR